MNNKQPYNPKDEEQKQRIAFDANLAAAAVWVCLAFVLFLVALHFI
jgi:hypothetical protein